ncbi:MAG: hypothetical protein K6L73_08030 [Cellvibrionaceae bacterium]
MISRVKFQHSISRRLLKIVLSLYFIFTFVTTALHVYLEYSSTKEDIQQELRVTESAFKSTLASSLWLLDYTQLDITTNGIIKSPLVTGIQVQNEKNQVVMEKSFDDSLINENTKGVFWNEFKLHYVFNEKKRFVGTVRLYSNNDIVVNRIKLGVQILIINAVLKTFILIILFTIVFHKVLTKPLEKLADDASNIDFERIDSTYIEVEEQGKNELTMLETALNKMIDKVSTSMETLDNLNKSLEEKVERRTQSLNDAVQQLEQEQLELKQAQSQLVEAEKMASLGSLVAGVAHEINTPIGVSLTGISHFQHMIEKIEKDYQDGELEEKNFEKFVDNSKEIGRSIYFSLDRAAKLVNSFKKVAVDQTSEVLRYFNVLEYTEEVLLSLQGKLRQTNISVSLNCDEDIQANGYPGSWSQIITNLIANSLIHAFKSGQVGSITLDFLQDGEDLVFIYNDNGKGMTPEVQAKIFDPFYTTNRDKGGSGLGMNITYNLVTQQMRGTITVDSAPEQGAKFTIRVPLDLSK